METPAIYNGATVPALASAIESVLITGDLAKLNPEQRLSYYKTVCESLGLNPLTKPFDYIVLNNKLTLYANKGCTDQLRRLYSVSVDPAIETKQVEGVYVVKVVVRDATGRTDVASGAVNLGTLKGEALANALMKAETKAKRRATLSLLGLGMLDETEIDTIRDARRVKVDDSGEIVNTNGTERDYTGADVPPIERPSPDFRQSIIDDPLGVGDDGDDSIAELAAQPVKYPGGCTVNQIKRLQTIATQTGWKPAEVKRLLKNTWGYASSKEITPDNYDQICADLESKVLLNEIRAAIAETAGEVSNA